MNGIFMRMWMWTFNLSLDHVKFNIWQRNANALLQCLKTLIGIKYQYLSYTSIHVHLVYLACNQNAIWCVLNVIQLFCMWPRTSQRKKIIREEAPDYLAWKQLSVRLLGNKGKHFHFIKGSCTNVFFRNRWLCGTLPIYCTAMSIIVTIIQYMYIYQGPKA